VQILVVVAITQVRYLWAEEEKGFIRTVIGYELVDPKQNSNEFRMVIGGNGGRGRGKFIFPGFVLCCDDEL